MADQQQFLLTDLQFEALAKVFKFADVEEKGFVDVETISTLAVQLLGGHLTESQKHYIKATSDEKTEEGLLSYNSFIDIMSKVMMQTTQWGKMKSSLESYVGFDTIQEQIRKKSLKRGFELNIMVVGASGLGKSTLVNTLFKAKLSRASCISQPFVIPKTVEIKTVSHVIEEKGVRLRLTITDTPGFGDQVNNTNCWEPVIEYIHDQFDHYYREESSTYRKARIPDTRVHCCLYFIEPTGHRLKSLDLEFMKRLDKCVNIIPVIAKSDTLTLEEREAFKRRIREDLSHNINTYPIIHDELDEDEVRTNTKIKEQLPFAVVGSDRNVSVGGKAVLGRKTRWGVIEVENKNHCEFTLLRDMLIKTHMQDLKEVTDFLHYESYRRERCSSNGEHSPLDEKPDMTHGNGVISESNI
ncbi:neuronal-specific septin-3-like [Paramuricea clavata]|nr:neuronal-specific septin-3-like [Paramuricea clavata]